MRHVNFEILTDVPLLAGKLSYERKENSFYFYPHDQGELLSRTGPAKTFSLLVSYYLQIAVGVQTSNMLSVWGYHPMATWIAQSLRPPASRPGLVRVHLDGPGVQYGVGYEISDEVRQWETWFDASNCWVCVGNLSFAPESELVEFASNTIAVIESGNLRALWLRPEFVDN